MISLSTLFKPKSPIQSNIPVGPLSGSSSWLNYNQPKKPAQRAIPTSGALVNQPQRPVSPVQTRSITNTMTNNTGLYSPNTNAIPQYTFPGMLTYNQSPTVSSTAGAVNSYDDYYNQMADYNRTRFDNYNDSANDSFDRYLEDAGVQFGHDRIKLDETAANNGNLFGGARNKQRNRLQEDYNRDIAGKRAQIIQALRDRALDYEYENGSDATPSISLSNATANAMDPTPTLNRSRSKVVRRQGGYKGRIQAERDANNFDRQAAIMSFWRNNQLPGYNYQ